MTTGNRGMSRAAREAGKSIMRGYGVMTSSLRTGPDFIIIGAKRGGTTSLYNYLLDHPSVRPLFPRRQRVKGPHFFDSEFARGPRWYRSHFPLAVGRSGGGRRPEGETVCGEASPYYLFHPLAAQRLAAMYPDVRLIVMLRDPVERAYSHYKERVRGDGETLGFAAALAAEESRLAGEAERIVAEPGYLSVAHEDHSYVAQGRYLDMLPRWFALFPPEQFHIVLSEDFYANPDEVVNGAWAFLGLPPAPPRNRKRYNYHQAADLEPATRQRLRQQFAEHNQNLAELLGRNLPWQPPGQGAPAAEVTQWPSVTAVVATRDRPELLKRAITSIVGQAYPGELECVVVFDQSQPAEVPVVVPQGRQLRVLTNIRTPGLAGARNTGITASTADLVAFCDDDDEWDTGKLRLQVERLIAGSHDFVASGVRIHHDDRVITRIPPASVALSQLVRSRVSALHPSTFVIRLSAIQDIGLVDEKIPASYGEDYDLLLRMARTAPVVSVEQPLVSVYWHRQSYFAERWESISAALWYLISKHPELESDPQGYARIEGQIAFAQAALGRRPEAWRASWRALRGNPRERRAYLALAVASGVLPAGLVVRLANSRGRGI
jgi:GT2 family glycosyltransferase